MKGPILIGGNPRSGTTFAARLLDAHPAIAVTAEINPEAARMACEMMHQLTRYMNRTPGRKVVWEVNRAQLMIDIWRSVSSPRIATGKLRPVRFAHKTPGSELRYEDYRAIFAPARVSLLYTFRDPLDILSSLLNMPWRPVPLGQRVEDLKRSVAVYEELAAEYPDDVQMLQVDKAPADRAIRRGLIHDIFSSWEEALTTEVVEFVDVWEPENRMSQIAGGTPRKDFTPEQRKVLRGDEELTSMRQRYGYQSSV